MPRKNPPGGKKDYDNIITGTKGDDVLVGTVGSDLIDGKKGFDTAVLSGDVRDYGYSEKKGAWSFSNDGVTDDLKNIEAVDFDDNVTIYLDGRNNGPLADDIDAGTDEDNAVGINLLSEGDAWDFEGDALSITAIDTAGTSGSVTLNPTTGVATYDPGDAFQYLNEGETATDTFPTVPGVQAPPAN